MSSENMTPGALPLFSSGWGAGNIKFDEADGFWDEGQKIANEGVLGESLDQAMAGKSSPRVWVLLHEPSEGHLSTAAALALAHELGARDQAVLLLDGDDEEARLTTWAGRRDQEGWIDLVRYGSSVLASGEPMPFAGRRGYLLGAGSFTPTDVTETEVHDLLSRLKRQADDILICAPTGAMGRVWAAEADLRLLCWDRSRRASGLVEDLAENFATAGIALTGLVGFGLPDDVETIQEDPVVPLMTEEEEVGISEETAAAVLSKLEEMDELETDLALEDDEFARRKGNSKVFWFVAVAAVALIGVSSIYYFKFLKVPSEGHFPPMGTEQQAAVQDKPQADVVQGGVAGFDSGLAALQEDSVSDGLPEGDVSHQDEPALEVQTDLGQIAGEETQDVETQAEEAQDRVDQLTGLQPAGEDFSPVLEESPEVQDESLGMDPYTTAVGSGGWALHVYSFPDSMQAVKEHEALAAKGFQSATRAIQLKDKGRWYRLYLGSFKTKAEANAARAKLMEELGEDWANPVRF